jgi:integrase/recombinase XerD
MTLTYAGSRLSEALALSADRVDLAAGVLVFETLKKRQAGIYRAVPVPPALLDALDRVYGIRQLQARRGKGRGIRLARRTRRHGGRRVVRSAGLAKRACATASAWPPSPPASHSTSRRNGSVTPSSPLPPSMPTLLARRKRISPRACANVPNFRPP